MGVRSSDSESKWCETGVYHVPLAFQCICECSDKGGENWDGQEGSEISVGEERVDIAWPLVCR